jgi:hypothetical protein
MAWFLLNARLVPHDSLDGNVVAAHVVGVPLANCRIEVALRANFAPQPSQQELVGRAHQVKPAGNASGGSVVR